MKFSLTMPFIKNLSIHQRPVGIDPQGQIIYEANPAEAPYIVYDSAQDAPVGFGVKVAGKKTFILRRKEGGKSMTAKVGSQCMIGAHRCLRAWSRSRHNRLVVF